MIDALAGIDGLSVTPVAGWSSLDAQALQAAKTETGLQLTGLGRRGTALLWTFLGQPRLEDCVANPVDVVHAAALGYPVATSKPLVVTIHDLGPLTHPEYFRNTRPWVMSRSLDQAVRQAAAIVCVSQSTAEEVRDYVGPAVDGRLHVVLEGVEECFFNRVDLDILAGLDLPSRGTPYILSAGKISPRKNVEGVIRAIGRIASEIPHHLVLVGGEGWEADAVDLEIRRAGLSGRVHRPGFVDNTQLRALYQNAAAYVHPSLYEGFGLTVLEAMASGTPVVTSDRASLPEVSGDAAIAVDPIDTEQLAASLLQVCTDRDLADTMRTAGIKRARAFRWADSARQMADIYRMVSR